MIQNISIERLKTEQIQQILAIVEVFKAKNKNNNPETNIDMIEYLLENPIHVDNLEFMKLEDIYDKK
ncbi:MAG: hypothetical protein F6J92_37200 [Symploca sp. SIO1A3]|nr:hypothetical protein [Symploca sp. SIO1A3]